MNEKDELWSTQVIELELLIRELRFVFYQVRSAISLREVNEGARSGVYGVLSELYHFGPRSIPMLLENRAVSRQYLQKMVNRLVDEGFVEFIENPQHKRSKLITLTEFGRTSLMHKRSRYREFLSSLPLEVSEGDLATSLQTLKTIRQALKEQQESGNKALD